MPGLSTDHILEVFSNPRDLQIRVSLDLPTRKFYFTFMRGPGEGFKLLVKTIPFASERKHAVAMVRTYLILIRKTALDTLASTPEHELNRLLRGPDHVIDERKVLSLETIDEIMKKVERHGVAATYFDSSDAASA